MKKILTLALTLLCACSILQAEECLTIDEVCDSLTVWMEEMTGVTSRIKLKSVSRHGGSSDIYFTRTFSDYPWDSVTLGKVRDMLSEALPKGQKLGELYCNGVNVKDYLKTYSKEDAGRGNKLVEKVGSRKYPKGLEGRNIALWQSHGRYFDASEGLWKWQRAPVNRTVEDLFTQSFVLKYLIPMLENSGAVVFTPRERDTQSLEVVIDNDPSFSGDRTPEFRLSGTYSESGRWADGGIGFCDAKAVYSGTDNPFHMGSVRKAECTPGNPSSKAKWSFSVPMAGDYAVYVSYRSIPQSSDRAHYTVFHKGGSTEMYVNQTISGSTWVYLGSFPFDGNGRVELDNSGKDNSYVTADAVRIGGGMGKIDRGGGISGIPCYCEGAMYNMQWSGVDSEIWEAKDDDYTNDFASRGAWVKSLRDDRDIPIDLSFGFHTDAGVASADTTIGTLAIYTLKSEGSRKMTNGLDRMSCRRFAQKVQDEVVKDIRANFRPDWNRRELWDRSYSESRTSDVPAMLLELLSHQNFEDMKYGLDPSFQFTVSRAVYKGMLKFLSELYGKPYTVQPLPVKNFKIGFNGGDKAALSWEPTLDSTEVSSKPSGYTVYTRIDDGAFDKGKEVKGNSIDIRIERDHIYSFRVVAWNDGGASFPSETLCIGSPSIATGGKVLIVNNFTRVSAPSWIESDELAGFDGREDNGVPYIDDISFVGQVYDFHRDHEWISNAESGYGACYTDKACSKVAGNTFDYPYLHGRVLMEMGLPFCSSSAGAFSADSSIVDIAIIDLICGKQKDVFPEALRLALRRRTSEGQSILLSGANVATPFIKDDSHFASDVLGFRWVSSHATPDGRVSTVRFGGIPVKRMKIYNEPNPAKYCVENPDALGLRSGSAAIASGSVVMRYDVSSLPAAIHFFGQGYKVAAYGFPLECLDSDKDFKTVLRNAIEFLK